MDRPEKPYIYKSFNEIRKTYCVRWDAIVQWMEEGAPIAVLENGRARAVSTELQAWLVERSKRVMSREVNKKLRKIMKEIE